MRCGMPSFRATATRARATPRGWATSPRHPPSAQAGPFRAARQQGVGKRGASECVAATVDPAFDVSLARLVSRRRQPQIAADGTGLRGAARRVDGGAEGERSDRTDAPERSSAGGRSSRRGRWPDPDVSVCPAAPASCAARPAGRDDGRNGLFLIGEVMHAFFEPEPGRDGRVSSDTSIPA